MVNYELTVWVFLAKFVEINTENDMKNEAELKLDFIRTIDKLNGNKLVEMYELVKERVSSKPDNKPTSIENAYKLMSEDIEREQAAFEWVEE